MIFVLFPDSLSRFCNRWIGSHLFFFSGEGPGVMEVSGHVNDWPLTPRTGVFIFCIFFVLWDICSRERSLRCTCTVTKWTALLTVSWISSLFHCSHCFCFSEKSACLISGSIHHNIYASCFSWRQSCWIIAEQKTQGVCSKARASLYFMGGLGSDKSTKWSTPKFWILNSKIQSPRVEEYFYLKIFVPENICFLQQNPPRNVLIDCVLEYRSPSLLASWIHMQSLSFPIGR